VEYLWGNILRICDDLVLYVEATLFPYPLYDSELIFVWRCE